MAYQILLDKKGVESIELVIQFEKEPKIRDVILKLEDALKPYFSKPAIIGPVSESDEPSIPRAIFQEANYQCRFTQVALSIVQAVPKDLSTKWENQLKEITDRAKNIFEIFLKQTSRHMKNIGIVTYVYIPMSLGSSGNEYIFNTFFKPNKNCQNLTSIEFKMGKQFENIFNLNMHVSSGRFIESPDLETLLVTVDINDYFEQKKEKKEFYEPDEINRVSNRMREFILKELDLYLKSES